MTRREIAVHIRTHSLLTAFLDVREFLLQVLSADENASSVLGARMNSIAKESALSRF